MLLKRTIPLLMTMLILAGCFRQAPDSFEPVGSENSGGITITQDVPTVEPTDDITFIDPNTTEAPTDVPTADSSSLEEASATPRVIVAAATNTTSAIPTATVVIPSSTPQVIPTATEPQFITPEVAVQVTQATAIPTATSVEATLQPTPTGVGVELIVGDCEYEVQNGDNLFRIALNNDVSLASLLSANNLTEASIIQPGQVLTIPNCEDDASPESTEEALELEPTAIVLDDCEYEIKTGDTLFSIALEYDLTLAALLTENNLPENAIIQPGQLLTIPNCEDGTEDAMSDDSMDETESQTVEATEPDQTVHVVLSSDTLITIARQYGVTVNSILQANTIPDPNNLTTGQQLIIPDTNDG